MQLQQMETTKHKVKLPKSTINSKMKACLVIRFTCFSIKNTASFRIWSSSWFARSFAFTAAAEIAVTAARFTLSNLLSSFFVSVVSSWTLLPSSICSSPVNRLQIRKYNHKYNTNCQGYLFIFLQPKLARVIKFFNVYKSMPFIH